MKRIYFAGLLATTLILAGCTSRKPKLEGNLVQPRIVAYLPMWNMPYVPDWSKITHVCLAFGVVQPDGTVNMDQIDEHKYIIGQARENGVKVLLSIGGGGSRNFSTAILDKATREKLVSNLSRITTSYRLDGIDVDYEEWEGGPGGASEVDIQRRDSLEQLYRELRATLGSDKLITAAVNADWDDNNFGLYNCFNNTMHNYLDFVSLMIYDETGPWSGTRTGPHSSWDFFEKAIDHWFNNRQLSAEKLVVGVPFYGYRFTSPTYAGDAQGISYRKILEMYPDEDAHLKDSIGLLYYDGLPTIIRKAETVKKKQLGGIMFWEITQDTDIPEKSLLNAIYDTLF